VVTEVGKSPINAQAAATGQAINFKVVVRLNETVLGARPGLSCTADIVTAERTDVLAVPIQALILREIEVDENGEVVREWEDWLANSSDAGSDTDESPGTPAAPATPASSPAGDAAEDTENGTVGEETENETVEVEGAFILRDGRAIFIPIEIGIAGERHFEVLSGIESGDKVITGPFDIIRTLLDGDRVQERESNGNGDTEEDPS
jgi:HlyD family secretion protein